MNFRDSFAFRLSTLRQYKRLSLTELGNRLGVTDEAVRLLEKGKRSPSFEVLCALAEYFDVSIDYLVGRSDDDAPTSFHSQWECDFRRNLADTLIHLENADLEAAYVDIDFYNRIADGSAPLTFCTACDIADELGVSLDFLIGRTDNSDVNR